MPTSNSIVLFSHEHEGLLDAIQELSVQAKSSTQLQAFLSSSCKVFREQVSANDGREWAGLDSFEDLVELAENHIAQQRRNSVVEITLLVTVQIGQLLVLAENDSSYLSDQLITVGFGFGSITRAIAETATTIDSLRNLGTGALSVATRLAIELQKVTRSIEVSSDQWAIAVPKGTVEEIERQLSKVNDGLRPLQQAYIGQILPDRLVIFGPPSTLSDLGPRSDLALDLTPTTTPVHSIMYGSHLPAIDMARVIGDASLEFLRASVEDIAYQRLNIATSLENMAAILRDGGNSEAGILVIGTLEGGAANDDIFRKNGVSIHYNSYAACPNPFGRDIDSIPSDAVAVVGMSGRFPESDSLDELWSLLMAGSTTHKEIPSDRFDIDDFYDPSQRKRSALVQRYGCFLKNPGDFDNQLFNISPREAMQMDPVQRMLLMTTYEALEMAGYSDSEQSTPPRIAAYFGQTIDDWKTINEQQGIDTHFLPAINRGFAPGRLCHYFKWAGGFYSIDTGCSSSATAICIARDALLNCTIDAAVVGGGTLLTAPEWFSGLGKGGFLSPTGACKTYTDQADGYCRGEGVAVVVLKRLRDAIREKDDVLAVIAGALRNTNAGEGSITHPGAKAQEALYRRTLRQAGVHPQDVHVIEMHGTGTQAGDRTETTAVRNVFASRRRRQPPIVGALKANIGHSEAAAGVVSLIKGILLLQCDTLPPQPNRDMRLNPFLAPILGPDGDMQLSGGQSWPETGSNPRCVFVNNFDAAGGNVSFLIHQLPASVNVSSPNKSDQRSHHIVVISAHTEKALSANKARLRDYLLSHPETPLASLAYTTTARRIHQKLREVYVATSTAGVLRQLGQPASAVSAGVSSIVFAFTGQGSQYEGMGSTLYSTSVRFRRTLDSYQRILDAQGIDCQILPIIAGSSSVKHDDPAKVSRDTQVATVALEIGLAEYWRSLGLQPTLLIGHSLGEYAALCVAGVISVADVLALTYERADLISRRCRPSQSCMLAVPLPANTVAWRLRDLPATIDSCEICCINGPSNTVVGGPVAAVEALAEYLASSDGVTCTRLRTEYAFHTRAMDPLLDELEACASRVLFWAPQLPVASTLLTQIVKSRESGVFDAKYFRRHTREAVSFSDTVRKCEEQGLVDGSSFVVEIGPHPTCINLMSASFRNAKPRSFPSLYRGGDDWTSISNCVAAAYRARVPISWTEFHKDHLDEAQLLSKLPTYAFDMRTFWVPYKTEAVEAAPLKNPRASNTETRLTSTCLHTVDQLRKDASGLSAVFTADLSDRHLAAAIGGHVVDGVAICPASIFIDMAHTAAAYLEKAPGLNAEVAPMAREVSCLEMTAPLVIRPDMDKKSLPYVCLESCLNESRDTVSIRFRSRRQDIDLVTEHGSCTIKLKNTAEPSEQVRAWSRMLPLIEARISTLKQLSRPSQVHVMGRQLFYKMFSEIVDYAAPYHAVEEAVIAANFHDAVFRFNVQADNHFGTYTCNPFMVDAAVHVAGFLLNADVAKPKKDVHIANQVGSLTVPSSFEPAASLNAYAAVRERDEKSQTSICDVYVFDDSKKLILACTDICFKKLDRDFFALLTGSRRAVAPRAFPTRNFEHSSTSTPSTTTTSSSSDSSARSSPSLSSQSDALDLATELFHIVIDKTGLSMLDLKSDSKARFVDMGVDSQMSIQILHEFRRITSVELPAAFFNQFPTPAEVTKELGIQGLDELDLVTFEPPKVKTTSNLHKRCSGNQIIASRERSSQKLLDVIADVLGLENSAFAPSTTFASLGLDSMLSIKTLSVLRQETGLELPAAFFTQFPTVSAARVEIDNDDDEAGEPPKRRIDLSTTEPKKRTVDAMPTSSEHRTHRLASAVSRAVLIQGSSRSETAPLFLTTDGSGTVESYIHLKPLRGGRRIYALESPFLLDRDDDLGGDATTAATAAVEPSIPEMAAIFIRTIRRIQPEGPYLIGGWSAGGVHAYEVARSLATQGDAIAALLVLDMRAPSLIPTAIVTPDFVDRLGTFEGINRARNLPDDLSVREKAHLMATCRALSRYDAPPFPPSSRPGTCVVVWAGEGLKKGTDADHPACMLKPGLEIGKTLEEMDLEDFRHYFNSWFYGRRTTFGKNGWEEYLGDEIDVYRVDGDHFSMMTPPFSDRVGDIVVESVEKASAVQARIQSA